KHPDWGGAVVGLLRRWVTTGNLDESAREGLYEAVRVFAANPEIQELVAQSLREAKTPLSTRLLLTEAISRTPLKVLPAAWAEVLDLGLRDRAARVAGRAIAAVRAVGGGGFDKPLGELGRDRSRPEAIRVAAWAAVAPRATGIGPDDFEFLRAQLDRDKVP